jgi:opacity protein-like surface antigen
MIWAAVAAVAPFFAPEAQAQPIAVGVRGGIQLVDWFKDVTIGQTGSGKDQSSKALVGPFVSLKLPARMALQVEALRRNYGFQRSDSRLGSFLSHEESGNAWEIAAILIWRPDYQENGWQPYAGAGPAIRYVNADFVDIVRRPKVLPADPPASETRTPGTRSNTHGGFVATAGMERKVGPLVFSTELRYSYWLAPTLLNDIKPNRNQVSILFGVRSR